MPANLITFAHFVVSAAMYLLKSSGVIGIGSPPSSTSRAFNLGSESPALISSLIVATMSAGGPLARATPYPRFGFEPRRDTARPRTVLQCPAAPPGGAARR